MKHKDYVRIRKNGKIGKISSTMGPNNPNRTSKEEHYWVNGDSKMFGWFTESELETIPSEVTLLNIKYIPKLS